MTVRANGRDALIYLGYAIERRVEKLGVRDSRELEDRDVLRMLYLTTGVPLEPRPLFSLEPSDFPRRLVQGGKGRPEPLDIEEYSLACAKLVAALNEAWHAKGCVVTRVDDGTGPFLFDVRQGGSMFEYANRVDVHTFVGNLPEGLTLQLLRVASLEAYHGADRPMVGVEPVGPDPALELERFGNALEGWF